MYFCKLFFFFLSPYQQFYHQGDSRRCEHESGLFVCQNAQAYFHLMTNGPEVVFSFIWFMFSRWPDDHLMINYIIRVWMQTVCRSSHCCSSSSCHRHTHTPPTVRPTTLCLPATHNKTKDLDQHCPWPWPLRPGKDSWSVCGGLQMSYFRHVSVPLHFHWGILLQFLSGVSLL